MLIAEVAFHLVGEILFYGVGRVAIIALSFGRIRPRNFKELWVSRADNDLAMQIYFEIIAIQLVGLTVLALIAVIGLLLRK